MSIRTLTRSFGGGELTPEFWGRIDDAKYQTGLALCRNCIVLPHGPVANRAGTTFVRETKDSTKKSKLIPFSYSTTQTFSIEMGAGYFRFHTGGATLLAGSPAAYAGGTTYALADLVSSGGVNYYSLSAGNIGHTPVSSPTFWYPLPSVAYEIPNPYAEADLFDIHYVQSADVLTLVHPNYAPMELRRLGATQWTLTAINFAPTLSPPGSVLATATVATGTGLIAMVYLVTAVDTTGLEQSLPSSSSSCNNNLLTTGNFNTITWASVANAARYNVYKQSNGLFGYIGQTDGLTFKDDNITADISKTPPISNTPFTGAGNFPGAVSYFEQRRDFAGTINKPQNIWMTHSGTESNLSNSIPTRDDDAISFRVAAREANTIRHIVPLTNLILLTSSAEWRVTSVNSDVITPTSISVRPQSYVGASNVQPLIVNSNLIFAAARGGHVRELAYAWQSSGYITGDVSLRAPHLFDGFNITDMAYSKSPYPIVYFASDSGYMLGFTYVPEQQIGSWHHHDSYTIAGMSIIESTCVVAEGAEDALYAIIRRVVNGASKRYVERFSTRAFAVLEDAYFVDAGATYNAPIPITGATKANPGVITATAHGLSNGNIVRIDDMLGMTQLNTLRFKVAGAAANTFQLTDEVTGANINTTAYGTYTAGGNVRKCISTLSSGLSHLEGETVSILADGAVHRRLTVTGGSVTLDQSAGRIQIGLPITADIQTLPMAFEVQAFGQGREKNVNKIWIRTYRSSGIFAGPDFNNLKEAKQRTTEPFGKPPVLKSDEIPITLTPSWASTGAVCIRQSDPLPLTIVSMTMEAAIGA